MGEKSYIINYAAILRRKQDPIERERELTHVVPGAIGIAYQKLPDAESLGAVHSNFIEGQVTEIDIDF